MNECKKRKRLCFLLLAVVLLSWSSWGLFSLSGQRLAGTPRVRDEMRCYCLELSCWPKSREGLGLLGSFTRSNTLCSVKIHNGVEM